MATSTVGQATDVTITFITSKEIHLRDTNRLYKFYEELREIHMKYFPDWRFGQLIYNVLGWWQTKSSRDIFFPEEDDMLEYLKEYFKGGN